MAKKPQQTLSEGRRDGFSIIMQAGFVSNAADASGWQKRHPLVFLTFRRLLRSLPAARRGRKRALISGCAIRRRC